MLLHERGIDISHETAWFRKNRFGTMFAAKIRIKRVQLYLWRAVDNEGEVVESSATKVAVLRRH
jgi:putative transposase